MPTLLLTIFLLQLTIHLINTIGASTINDLLWTLYTSLPFASSQTRAQHDQTTLRREVVQLKREIAATSAQDNFSKWAKIRRKHDSALQRHDEIAAANSATKSQFNTYASATRWIATNGLRLFLQFWYARTAVFRLPGGGWVPGWVEWVVGFPGVKRGVEGNGVGVSVQVWGWVCVVVIGLVGEGLAWGVERWIGIGIGGGRARGDGKGRGEGTEGRTKIVGAAAGTKGEKSQRL